MKINAFYEVLEKIKEKSKEKSLKTSEFIKFVIKKSGIEDYFLKEGTEEDAERLANIKEIVTLATKYDELETEEGIEKLIEDASLASDQDDLMFNKPKITQNSDKEKNAVRLMTVHASKGLEFKYVFITGLEEGLFPSRMESEGPQKRDDEEERRLFYVALTRAEQKLILSFANFRTIYGSKQMNSPSEFLNDIPKDILEREGESFGVKTIYI